MKNVGSIRTSSSSSWRDVVVAGVLLVVLGHQQYHAAEAASTSTAAMVKSIVSNSMDLSERHDNLHRLLSTIQQTNTDNNDSHRHNLPRLHRRRKLEDHPFDFVGDSDSDSDSDDEAEEACDSAFIQCLPHDNCVGCFATLETEDIDWTGVSSDTTCDDVVDFLTDGDHCTNLIKDEASKVLFCNAFNACVIWDDDNDNPYDDDDAIVDPDYVDCSKLTECDWDGIHANWIGDGVCHDNVHGCYNTELCGYDGGDCCEDTCQITSSSSFLECGHEGYKCRDPESTDCDATLNRNCPGASDGSNNDDKKNSVVCNDDETKYRLVMYDSFGDGWDTTVLTIRPEGTDDVTFKGGLVDGYQGTEYICLSKTAQCYSVTAEGGTWGVEVSWEIRPINEGSPSIAGGAAPADCDFSVAGDVCDKTCDGSKPDIDPTKDPEYRSFKDMYECIADKCMIQLGTCNQDESCRGCFDEDAPDYCFGLDSFVAVIDCTVCSCTDRKGTAYCTEKTGPGQVNPPDGENDGPKECSPKETMAGASAIMEFGKCSDMDEVFLLVSEFDQNNFGMLDKFESCAHSFQDEKNHGGHTALECMKILKDTMTNPVVEDNEDAPVEAIAALAKNLYDHAETFCDCAKSASDNCPLCPNFMNFKTLLYESLDACESLDAIDCDSWKEFWKPCKANLEGEFGSSDFSSKDQCEYVKQDCGDSTLAFPAFRRLDCEGEISDDAWSFYKLFSKKCLKGADGIAPSDPPPITPTSPVPAPSSAPDSKPTSADKPTPKPYIPSDDKKPYIPSDDRGSSSGSSSDTDSSKSKSHWFRNLVIILSLGGVGYYVYKKRFDNGFNFVQYRRRVFGNRFGGSDFSYGMVNTGGGVGNEMYSNLNSSTTFEPPSLPPTPQMMGGPSMMMSNVGQMGQQMMGTEMT